MKHITLTIGPDDRLDVMHNLELDDDLYIKVINQKEEWTDTVTDIIFASEDSQMEFLNEHYNEGFEDRAL